MEIIQEYRVEAVSTNPDSMVEDIESIALVEVDLVAGATATLTAGQGTKSGTITWVDTPFSFDSESAFAIYWDGGALHSAGYSTADATTLTFSSGVGDNLPTNGTTVVVALQQTVVMAWPSLSSRVPTYMLVEFDITGPTGIGPAAFRFADSSGYSVVTDWTELDANQIMNVKAIDPTVYDALFVDFLTGSPPSDIYNLQFSNGYTKTGTIKFMME